MLVIVTWAAWIISAALLLWLLWDFMSVNLKYGNDVLLSSREGVDDLFGDGGSPSRTAKGD
ncbi:MAG: hypothetical protein EPN75_05820 [Beijerinckiaceae bacterium]|nr:MAG: hypothetical protein EPN75_05820 [Beijerinckiaceae bacterium]